MCAPACRHEVRRILPGIANAVHVTLQLLAGSSCVLFHGNAMLVWGFQSFAHNQGPHCTTIGVSFDFVLILLSSPPPPPPPILTLLIRPDADILVQYLKEYAKVQEGNGRMRYNTTVLKISRESSSKTTARTATAAANAEHSGTTAIAPPTRLIIKTTSPGVTKPGGAPGAPLVETVDGRYSCKVVVVATGLSTPNIPKGIDGIELAQGYEDVPKEGSAYEQQSVLVLGQGNAGQ